jgi:cytochrome P450
MSLAWSHTSGEALSDLPVTKTPTRAKVAPFIGLFHGARKDPLHFFLKAAESCEVVEFPNAVGRFFLINEPEIVDQVLRAKHRNYPKSQYYERVRPLFGDGLFELEGEKWKLKRQTMQPAFHKQATEGLAQIIVDEVGATLEDWGALADRREAFDIVPPLMQMTFKIITKAMCGTALPHDVEEISDALTTILQAGERLLWAAFPAVHHLPSPRKARLKRALETFDRFILDLVEKRREMPDEEVLLIDLLLASRNPETGAPLSERELRDDLMTMLIAGHETTALAIAWACYLLSKNPQVHDKLRQENRAVLGGRVPSLADLQKLDYHRAVINETLRLYPPFWTLSRQAVADDVLSGYHIPAGATVMVAPYVLHRHPRYWSNPEGFYPERFSDPDLAKAGNFAYFPFGGGPRVCIGKNLALIEAQLYLAMLVQRFDLELQPGWRVEPRPMISLRPSDGIRMRVKASPASQPPSETFFP